MKKILLCLIISFLIYLLFKKIRNKQKRIIKQKQISKQRIKISKENSKKDLVLLNNIEPFKNKQETNFISDDYDKYSEQVKTFYKRTIYSHFIDNDETMMSDQECINNNKKYLLVEYIYYTDYTDIQPLNYKELETKDTKYEKQISEYLSNLHKLNEYDILVYVKESIDNYIFWRRLLYDFCLKGGGDLDTEKKTISDNINNLIGSGSFKMIDNELIIINNTYLWEPTTGFSDHLLYFRNKARDMENNTIEELINDGNAVIVASEEARKEAENKKRSATGTPQQIKQAGDDAAKAVIEEGIYPYYDKNLKPFLENPFSYKKKKHKYSDISPTYRTGASKDTFNPLFFGSNDKTLDKNIVIDVNKHNVVNYLKTYTYENRTSFKRDVNILNKKKEWEKLYVNTFIRKRDFNILNYISFDKEDISNYNMAMMEIILYNYVKYMNEYHTFYLISSEFISFEPFLKLNNIPINRLRRSIKNNSELNKSIDLHNELLKNITSDQYKQSEIRATEIATNFISQRYKIEYNKYNCFFNEIIKELELKKYKEIWINNISELVPKSYKKYKDLLDELNIKLNIIEECSTKSTLIDKYNCIQNKLINEKTNLYTLAFFSDTSEDSVPLDTSEDDFPISSLLSEGTGIDELLGIPDHMAARLIFDLAIDKVVAMAGVALSAYLTKNKHLYSGHDYYKQQHYKRLQKELQEELIKNEEKKLKSKKFDKIAAKAAAEKKSNERILNEMREEIMDEFVEGADNKRLVIKAKQKGQQAAQDEFWADWGSNEKRAARRRLELEAGDKVAAKARMTAQNEAKELLSKQLIVTENLDIKTQPQIIQKGNLAANKAKEAAENKIKEEAKAAVLEQETQRKAAKDALKARITRAGDIAEKTAKEATKQKIKKGGLYGGVARPPSVWAKIGGEQAANKAKKIQAQKAQEAVKLATKKARTEAETNMRNKLGKPATQQQIKKAGDDAVDAVIEERKKAAEQEAKEKAAKDAAEKTAKENAEKKIQTKGDDAARIARTNAEKKIREEGAKQAALQETKNNTVNKAIQARIKSEGDEAARVAREMVEKEARKTFNNPLNKAARKEAAKIKMNIGIRKAGDNAEKAARTNVEENMRKEATKKAKEEAERKGRLAGNKAAKIAAKEANELAIKEAREKGQREMMEYMTAKWKLIPKQSQAQVQKISKEWGERRAQQLQTKLAVKAQLKVQKKAALTGGRKALQSFVLSKVAHAAAKGVGYVVSPIGWYMAYRDTADIANFLFGEGFVNDDIIIDEGEIFSDYWFTEHGSGTMGGPGELHGFTRTGKGALDFMRNSLFGKDGKGGNLKTALFYLAVTSKVGNPSVIYYQLTMLALEKIGIDVEDMKQWQGIKQLIFVEEQLGLPEELQVIGKAIDMLLDAKKVLDGGIAWSQERFNENFDRELFGLSGNDFIAWTSGALKSIAKSLEMDDTCKTQRCYEERDNEIFATKLKETLDSFRKQINYRYDLIQKAKQKGIRPELGYHTSIDVNPYFKKEQWEEIPSDSNPPDSNQQAAAKKVSMSDSNKHLDMWMGKNYNNYITCSNLFGNLKDTTNPGKTINKTGLDEENDPRTNWSHDDANNKIYKLTDANLEDPDRLPFQLSTNKYLYPLYWDVNKKSYIYNVKHYFKQSARTWERVTDKTKKIIDFQNINTKYKKCYHDDYYTEKDTCNESVLHEQLKLKMQAGLTFISSTASDKFDTQINDHNVTYNLPKIPSKMKVSEQKRRYNELIDDPNKFFMENCVVNTEECKTLLMTDRQMPRENLWYFHGVRGLFEEVDDLSAIKGARVSPLERKRNKKYSLSERVMKLSRKYIFGPPIKHTKTSHGNEEVIKFDKCISRDKPLFSYEDTTTYRGDFLYNMIINEVNERKTVFEWMDEKEYINYYKEKNKDSFQLDPNYNDCSFKDVTNEDPNTKYDVQISKNETSWKEHIYTEYDSQFNASLGATGGGGACKPD